MGMPEVTPVGESHPVEESPPEVGGLSLSNDEFQKRVSIVMDAIEDPEKFRRAIAEIHTYLSMFEQGFREMQQEMANSGGPMGMIRKMMMGR